MSSLPADAFKGRVALVTGGSSGIGRATALVFARRGCHVAVHYNSNKAGAAEVEKELASICAPGTYTMFQGNLSSYDVVRAMHAAVVAKLGPIDILFSNHGQTGQMLGRGGNIEDLRLEEFEAAWKTNTASHFLLAQLCVPHMVEKKWGRVVFCASVAAGTGGVVGPHYASSKSALHGIIHWIAQRYARDGVTCNGVAPALITSTGMIPTPVKQYEDLIPIGRHGEPEEIASVVEMLVGNAYMTNKIITADGGWTTGV